MLCFYEAIYAYRKQKDEALKIWGHPTSFSDISKLFERFCVSNLVALPWSDERPSPETAVIGKQLEKLNELGFLTINSQPAVNGAPSNDKVHGWGPSNGYVYQKVRNLNIAISWRSR